MNDRKIEHKNRRGTTPDMRTLPLCMRPNGKAKTGYASRAKANQARIKHNADVWLYTYRCPRCQQWHITSKPQTATPVELIDGGIVLIDKPPAQVQSDLEAARTGDYTHIKWASYHRAIAVHRIRRVIQDAQAA